MSHHLTTKQINCSAPPSFVMHYCYHHVDLLSEQSATSPPPLVKLFVSINVYRESLWRERKMGVNIYGRWFYYIVLISPKMQQHKRIGIPEWSNTPKMNFIRDFWIMLNQSSLVAYILSTYEKGSNHFNYFSFISVLTLVATISYANVKPTVAFC